MVAWTNVIVWFVATVNSLLNLYFWIVIIAAVMTWIEPNPYNPIVRFLYAVTEPVFDFVREHLPVTFGGIDFSPLVVLLAIRFLQRVVLPTFIYYAIPGYA